MPAGTVASLHRWPVKSLAGQDPEILRWLTREHGGLFGINARVRGSGRIAVGDAVELVPA